MKTLILISSVLVLSACGGGSGGGSASGGSGGGIWPGTALQTDSYGAITCATLSTGGVECYDGATYYTIIGLSAITFTLSTLQVSANMVCVLEEPAGAAADCVNLLDGTCTAPATNNNLYCASFGNLTGLSIDQGPTWGFIRPGYNFGIKSISVNGGGQMCLVNTTYKGTAEMPLNDFKQEDSGCYTNVDPSGFLN